MSRQVVPNFYEVAEWAIGIVKLLVSPSGPMHTSAFENFNVKTSQTYIVQLINYSHIQQCLKLAKKINWPIFFLLAHFYFKPAQVSLN